MRSQLILTFFGLRPEYKRSVLDGIWEVIKYTQGGLDFITLYNMPIYMRTYYFNKFVQEIKELNSPKSNKSNKNIDRPNISPK